MASSRAHLRLDSWWPRPAQGSQILPGQSILLPQYKYFSWRLCCLSLLGLFKFLKENEEEEKEKPFMERREENMQRNAMTDKKTRIKIGDLGFVLSFRVLEVVAIGVRTKMVETHNWECSQNLFEQETSHSTAQAL